MVLINERFCLQRHPILRRTRLIDQGETEEKELQEEELRLQQHILLQNAQCVISRMST